MYKLFYLLLFSTTFISCSNSIVSSKNEQAGRLQSKYNLIVNSEKKILLDDYTAPKSPYMQIYQDTSGIKMLTLLNPYNNSIYFYNYTNGEFIKKFITIKRVQMQF